VVIDSDGFLHEVPPTQATDGMSGEQGEQLFNHITKQRYSADEEARRQLLGLLYAITILVDGTGTETMMALNHL
jgi:hypothetical protein